MTSSNDKSTPPASNDLAKRRKQTRILLIIMLLVLLLLWLFQWRLSVYKEQQLQILRQADSLAQITALTDQDSLRMAALLRIKDSLQGVDSLAQSDSLRIVDSLRRVDSLQTLSVRKGRASGEFKDDSDALLRRKADSLRRADSLALTKHVNDSLLALANIAAQKATDPNPPSPVLVPPPGRYYQSVNLKVNCGEPKCSAEMSLQDTLTPKNGLIPVAYNKAGTVYFRATDSLGNTSAWQSGVYDMAGDNRCVKNSFPVSVNGKQVCVDAYEYPNQAGQKPRDMVTHEAATRLCTEAGKRLCTIDEWQAACKGKDNFKYSYGNRYDQNKCVTASSESLRSGYAEQCRSWWGMYDMGGNLWEWTASTAPQRSNLYLVAGGSWNTQNASSCSETKFSFYPQNEYAFVGFRCCSTAQ